MGNLNTLWDAVKAYFGEDQRLIEHTEQVLDWARQILKNHQADQVVVEAAAMVHDIGIPEAERKHGSAAGPYQELEGPPIAHRLLTAEEFAEGEIDHVCRIVGSHHSLGEVNTPEFLVIWDADALVNLGRRMANMSVCERQKLIDQHFQTTAGKALAERLFL